MSYDAVEFLCGLYRPDPAEAVEPDPAQALTPGDLPVEWWELWDERAAIMEFDGNMPRERAEALALADIVERMKREGATDSRVRQTGQQQAKNRGEV